MRGVPGTAHCTRSSGLVLPLAPLVLARTAGGDGDSGPLVLEGEAPGARPERAGNPHAFGDCASIDTYSSCAWAELVTTTRKRPTSAQTSALAHRIASELQQAGWQVEGVLTDNGTEFGRREFAARLPAGTRHSQIRSGRPQTNGHVERLHRTILEESWRPAFARHLQVRLSGLRRDLATCLTDYNHQREHHGRITAGATPLRSRLRCPQNGAEMSRPCRHISESVQPRRRRPAGWRTRA